MKKLKMWLILMLLPKKALEMCQVIDNWSVKNRITDNYGYVERDECEKMWDIITAMRGPDKLHQDSHEIKEGSTAILRSKAFPNMAKHTGAIVRHKDLIDMSVFKDKEYDYHFKSHINRGARSLGIPFKPHQE